MASSAHSLPEESSELLYEDYADDEEYEEEEEGEDFDEWAEDDEEDNLTRQLDSLGLHSSTPMPLAIKSASSSRRSTNNPNSFLPIGIGRLNAKSKVDEPFLIIPGLYLGSEAHAKREEDLKRLGVTHVLAIHDRAKAHYPQSFEYFIISIRDEKETPISEHFREAHEFIRDVRETNGGAVFVHCWAGISRSATIVISYIMQLEKLSYFDALNRTLSAKPDVQPNSGFVLQLRAFEKSLGIQRSSREPRSSQKDLTPRYRQRDGDYGGYGGSSGKKSRDKRSMKKGQKGRG